MIRVVANYKDIYDILNYYSKDLEPIRAGRIDLDAMARKFTAFGTVIELIEDGVRKGYAGFYHNDRKLGRAFLYLKCSQKVYKITLQKHIRSHQTATP